MTKQITSNLCLVFLHSQNYILVHLVFDCLKKKLLKHYYLHTYAVQIKLGLIIFIITDIEKATILLRILSESLGDSMPIVVVEGLIINFP